ncbi:Mitochondrial uncoupling protein 2 [Sesamum alatum]|uniref:Mitochondrial uncoupling protein 2 n=1 Tax=Sesamum alatum TaxID=300844 RepID=A0AAE1XV75_9LAMI|nr:Mitochondrial uncoupling protein 2 [Sesamum alatum]
MAGDSSSGSIKARWGVSPSDVAYHFGTSGMSVAAATGITHPLDVLKVRLQMQLVGQRGPLTGMGSLSMQVVKTEGLRSLYLGLTPALTRSVLYGGLRLGLYEPSKYVCELAFESTNVFMKIASGAFSGAVATALTNPVEVLKVRMQMNTKTTSGPIQEMQKIASEEGVAALWKGVGPAIARAAALTASQLATYDESKQWSQKSCLNSSTLTNAGADEMDFSSGRILSASHVMLTEGPRGLYKGGFAIFARLGPQTTITFILCEKLRELAGLKAL